jgi:predicted acylesterase/phospholipase RssA
MSGRAGDVRLGLTLSGAISLGAYEGGVLAALVAGIQALNARDDSRGALRIDAIAGASAGSITGLLTARALLAGLDPIDTMYGAWVDTPQLERLVDGRDSPLSTQATSETAVQLLAGTPQPGRAQATPIRVHMALACLRGLDYQIGRIGGPPIRASTFLDWSEWTIRPEYDVDWYVQSGAVKAALASGAHAAAFPPIGLDRSDPNVQAGYDRARIDRDHFPPSNFLWYTDGGTIDNEPLGRALDLTEAIDVAPGDELGDANRLHLMITPDPARPASGDDVWSTERPAPTWARTGLRATKLMRSQHLYDDLRRLEKTNSRIAWLQQVETTLLAIIDGRVDAPAQALKATSEDIRRQREQLLGPEDLRPRDEGSRRADSPLAEALGEALALATGFAGKRDIMLAVISPDVLPEVARGESSPRDVLAGDFLGHFGGFMAQELRESDFALGYRSTLTWLETGELADRGLADDLTEAAIAGVEASRVEWEERHQRKWRADGLGESNLRTRSLGERFQALRLALRAARIAFRQARKGL